jgi:hypothetical protein
MEPLDKNKKPNDSEFYFLNYSYNFFLDILEETRGESFWQKDPYYRLNRTRDAFLIYSEILEYEPVGWFLEALKTNRPPMEAEMSKEFLLFVRNLLIHFPFFKSWDEVKFTKDLINWSKPGKSIDKFLSRFTGHEEFKCRVWNPEKKVMTYISVNFPSVYTKDSEIYLKNLLPEKEGIIFFMSLMWNVLSSQVDSIVAVEDGEKREYEMNKS